MSFNFEEILASGQQLLAEDDAREKRAHKNIERIADALEHIATALERHVE